MFWVCAEEIPSGCHGIDGYFSFSWQDGVLVCHQHYSPFSKNRKEVAILPETPGTPLAVAPAYGQPGQVAYFGLDREWLVSTVQFSGAVALSCTGNEADVLWKVDGTAYRVSCAVGRHSQSAYATQVASSAGGENVTSV